MEIQLEVSKPVAEYMTRDRQKACIMYVLPATNGNPFVLRGYIQSKDGPSMASWRKNGSYHNSGEYPSDLICPWIHRPKTYRPVTENDIGKLIQCCDTGNWQDGFFIGKTQLGKYVIERGEYLYRFLAARVEVDDAQH